MPYLQTSKTNIYYEEQGHPDDPLIVMIMGLATQLIAWPKTLRDNLVAAGYRVVCFDNRDTGLSSKWSGIKPNILHQFVAYRFHLPIKAPYTLDDMAIETGEIITGLGVERAHVIGASMGGMIGQILAAQHPEKVLSLTSIMSSSGSRNIPLPKRRIIQRLLTRSKQQCKETYIEHAIKTMQMIQSPAYPTNETEIKAYIEESYHRCHYPIGYIRQLSAVMASGDRTPLLKKIDCPTLVIHGKEDPLSPVDGGIHTALHIKNAKIELIDGMGHNLPEALVPRISKRIVEHIS